MRNKILFVLVIAGLVAGLVSSYFYARPVKSEPPVFRPAPNPYVSGIYANGIVESYQPSGENINIYPEVSGTVTRILVAEGQHVKKGTPLVQLDDSIQRALVQQQRAQAAAAMALLNELEAEPRKETLEVARAQVDLAAANLKTAQQSLAKLQRSYQMNPRSVAKDTLDTAVNNAEAYKASLEVARKQLDLTKAGAWIYDITNQKKQYEALTDAAAASAALLGKYILKAPADGVVLSVMGALGSFVSPQGVYNTYTQGYSPFVVMGEGNAGNYLAVRCFIDEILIPRLPPPGKLEAKMFIRGTTISVPLEFVRVQPYVTPKIELSDQRLEKVDLRVLPIVFRFKPPKGIAVFPGQLVDVYVGGKMNPEAPPP